MTEDQPMVADLDSECTDSVLTTNHQPVGEGSVVSNSPFTGSDCSIHIE